MQKENKSNPPPRQCEEQRSVVLTTVEGRRSEEKADFLAEREKSELAMGI